MRVIAITGASGFIGQHLVEFLSNQDKCRIRVLVHQNPNVDAFNRPNVAISEGDLSKAETLQRLIEPGCTVVNLVYLWGRSREENLEAIDNLANVCAKAKVKRMIHCSTAVVVGDVQDNLIDEETICNPIKEYETTKLEIEELLLGKYGDLFELVILRPTAVFGPKGKNLVKLANDLITGKRLINYLRSCVFNYRRMNLVCIENVVASIAFLIEYDKIMNNEVFIISDDEYGSNNYRAVENYLNSKFGYTDYPLPYILLPLFILTLLLKFAGKSNPNPKRVYECKKLLSTGFKKPMTFDEALDRFADWCKREILQ